MTAAPARKLRASWYVAIDIMARKIPPPLPALLSVALLLPVVVAPAAADDVHLTNGETFEGVVATVEGDRVAIRLPHGLIRLPASRVLRVERAVSAFEEFLLRSGELAGSGDAAAWLALARWAGERELPSGEREAALRAARLDPGLSGLEPVMRQLGYGFDEETGTWIPLDELMSRRGFVRLGGEWVPAEVAAESARRAAEERERRAAAAREARLDRMIALLAVAQLQEIEEDREEPAAAVVPYGGAVAFGAPVATAHGGVFVGPVRPRRAKAPVRRHVPHAGRGLRHTSGLSHHQGRTFDWNALAGRQPGSIIPIAVDPGASARSQD